MNDQPIHIIYPGGQRLEIIQGDITAQRVDAIVNAANAHLQHGGGVAAAIARAGGPLIQQESNTWVSRYGPVQHDQPAYTPAGRLPARYVLHAVGPVWGEGDEDHKLAQAITASLELAARLKLQTVAFPAISTGIFGFPLERAARIFVETMAAYFQPNRSALPSVVRIVLFDTASYSAFLAAGQAWVIANRKEAGR